MTELQQQLPAVEKIKQIIEAKGWYVRENGEFSFEQSIIKMAQLIGLEIDRQIDLAALAKIKEAIEKSFTPEALAKTETGYFIDSLLQIDPSLILWSEGDPAWQKVKAANTTVLNGVKAQRVEFISKTKTDHLPRIMSAIVEEHQSQEICILVIDDKAKNLAAAQALSAQMAKMNVEIAIFQINLKDAAKSPTACMEFIAKLQSRTGKKIRIITDMDGTLIKTDEVMANAVPEKIAEILKIESSNYAKNSQS